MVKIHGDTFVCAEMVISVQALGEDHPPKDSAIANLLERLGSEPMPPHVKIVWSEGEHAAALIVSCATVDEARKLARRIRRRVNRGIQPKPDASGTFSGVWDEHLTKTDCGPNSPNKHGMTVQGTEYLPSAHRQIKVRRVMLSGLRMLQAFDFWL